MKDGQSIATETVAGEDLVHPLMGGAVFGEQDHPALIPLTVEFEIGSEPIKDRFGFGVDLILGCLSPRPQLVQHLLLLRRQWLRAS
ncbi:Unknown protein sequence [Pseudomonas syringae pv. antirrhini]|uniref:Uncharacterized protein n=1 Tax=Pseudomonas syringae pv. antirrhini TaxID=251702 RepID=A0A0P9NUS6_9PSED|nr:Unknown protein sequence [Pseudomonas syringae pv. antirrhini]